MSRLFGELRQIGIVVRDIEAAMQHWVEAVSYTHLTLPTIYSV